MEHMLHEICSRKREIELLGRKKRHNKGERQISVADVKLLAPNYATLNAFISSFSRGFKRPRDGIHFTVLDIICAHQLVLINNAAICEGYYNLRVNIARISNR